MSSKIDPIASSIAILESAICNVKSKLISNIIDEVNSMKSPIQAMYSDNYKHLDFT